MVNIKKAKKGTIKHPRNNTFPKHFFLNDSHLLKKYSFFSKTLECNQFNLQTSPFPLWRALLRKGDRTQETFLKFYWIKLSNIYQIDKEDYREMKKFLLKVHRLYRKNIRRTTDSVNSNTAFKNIAHSALSILAAIPLVIKPHSSF